MERPHYFVAVFGDPQPGKDAVDSGIYTPHQNSAPFQPKPGDVMLLYCTQNYPAHGQEIPGIGVVLRVDSDHIEYRWVPFASPISKITVEVAFDPADVAQMKNIRFYTKWLFEISQGSFSKAVGNRTLAWEKI